MSNVSPHACLRCVRETLQKFKKLVFLIFLAFSFFPRAGWTFHYNKTKKLSCFICQRNVAKIQEICFLNFPSIFFLTYSKVNILLPQKFSKIWFIVRELLKKFKKFAFLIFMVFSFFPTVRCIYNFVTCVRETLKNSRNCFFLKFSWYLIHFWEWKSKITREMLQKFGKLIFITFLVFSFFLIGRWILLYNKSQNILTLLHMFQKFKKLVFLIFLLFWKNYKTKY